MQPSPVISLSPAPSFTSYSSSRLAEIAARVVEEFRAENHDYGGDGEDYGGADSFLTDYEESLCENGFHFRDKLMIDEGKSTDKNGGEDEEDKDDDDEEDEEEFEFAVVGRDFIPSPTPADEIFYNGQIRPCFPLFNQDLLLDGAEDEKEAVGFTHQKPTKEVLQPSATAARRLPLRKLFIEDRDPPSSCSSSEADELDGVQPDSYCVWNPKMATAAAAAEEGRCKKSSSTGSCSSKRWRLRNLLHRSNSDGKDSFVFLSHSESRNARKREGNTEKIEKLSGVAPEIPKSAAGKVAPEIPKAAAGKVAPASAVYVKNDGERRRMSFLPYRQDLVGFFSNVNGLSRNLHPF
ncbi:uncharacterized protein [Coffea arabica]|uniref:Uncharacterized protein n=1 Tax=Coffea arabica TaxID=13443 RepID=A0A6P6X8F1_COFAR|nr:uncharacterized protein LOC113739142 [Coffea arabica]